MIDGVNLLKVCDVLGVNPKWLMHGKQDLNVNSIEPEVVPARQFEPRPALMQWVCDAEGEILSCYRTTDDDGKSKITRTARAVKKVLLLDLVVDKSKM